MKRVPLTNKVKAGTAFFLLVLLILVIYSNTFHASWQFDDKPNILDNQRLHLTELSPASFKNLFFVKDGQSIFNRPLPILSFAINWYLGQDKTFGYHLINLAIHVTTAFILYLTTFSHALDDVCDGLNLDRVDGPQDGIQQGNEMDVGATVSAV
ncbi:hypothetical protein ACFL2E_02025 [Thermodesulfobacteriota bacterium]